MKHYCKINICFVFVSIVLVVISNWLESSFLEEFLFGDLIILLLALLAINTTTSSVIMAKLKEISEKHGRKHFTATIDALKGSLYEQVVYIGLALILLVLGKSELLIGISDLFKPAFLVMLTTVFVGSIYVLYDTANSIFVILKFENDEE